VPDPVLDERRRAEGLEARSAVADEPEAGCPYEPRCPLAEQVCIETDPALLELAASHLVACHVAARQAGLASPAAVP
jgi:ABC-type antimicrobial peptide transport system ATPase subunit